jgi:hypothetical protein
MDKRGQISAGVIVILVLLVVVLIALIFIILLRPGIFTGFSINNNQDDNNNILTCNSPYIKVGNLCCLDSNYNRICDKDEQNNQNNNNGLVCLTPYIKKGDLCCLDYNKNGICDSEEQSEDRLIIIRSSVIDSPFRLDNIDFDKNSLDFRIENRGNKDLVIKRINIDDCDHETFNRALNEDERKSFSFDCDFGSSGKIDVDVEIDYLNSGSNATETAYGRIRAELR